MPTVGSTLRSTAARVLERRALVFGDTDYSYAELDKLVDQVAGVLAERGLRRGDRLALLATNSDRFVIAFYAAHRLGAVFIPVNAASSPPELDYILRDSGASALVFDPALTKTVAAAQGNGLPDGLRVFALGPSTDTTTY